MTLLSNFNVGSTFGDATQRTKLGSVSSINNIALHISLVSPADGRGDTSAQSGYTDEQYKSLAAQVLLWQAKFGIPFTRLTTHAAWQATVKPMPEGA